ncbi:hypothetical protein HID58_083421 [Brassica napus]|uniref:CRAL-TRIO domain-containing protein n=1 Tax=Brassica napus TaxID=3708 RepID=A0ABQ7YDD5_BRANA|nr:hypothetical protein HID58_083421 [Brassica napus]
MEESQEELALTQLRKSVEKLSSSTEGYEKPTLMRFLIARSMNPNKAAKMFVDWQKWRASMIPPPGCIPDSEVKDELETRKMFLQGPTKSGQPLVVCKVSKHFPSKDQLPFKKFLVHVLDKSIARFVCRFLDKATKEKIVIVTDAEEQQRLEEEVGLDALPEEYGGRAKLTAFQDVLYNLLGRCTSTSKTLSFSHSLSSLRKPFPVLRSSEPKIMEESQEELALTQLRKSVEKLSSSTEGPTKSGHPMVLVITSKHFPAKDQVIFKKFVVHVLDKTIASGIKGKEVGDEKLVAVIDLSNITYKNLDARGLITGFQFLQSYYPERLAKCYILHMPGFFLTVWRFVCRFLDKATKEKIVIVTEGEEERKFKEEIGLDALPEEYGGRAKLTLIQDVLLPQTAPQMLTTNNDNIMEESQELALTQLRKSVEKLSSSTEGYEVPTLMRFLVARSMNPDKAAKMFVDWQKWRASMVPPNGIPDSEVKDELEFKRIYLQGLTKSGQPLVSKHFPAKDPVTFKKFVVHVLDKTIASGIKGKEVGDEKLVAVIDLSNITYKNLDARGFITGFQFLQSYYPERLAKCYILHMPGFFLTVWRFICRFLEKATQEKIVIVTDEEEERKFKEEIGVDALPEEYGGQAKLTLIQDNDTEVKVTATCIRVPLMRAHAESVNLQFENPLDENTARELLKKAPGVYIIDDRSSNTFPTPLDVSNKDDVAVGRIRRDVSQDGNFGLDIFVCGDQIGAALNAVQIAEMLL